MRPDDIVQLRERTLLVGAVIAGGIGIGGVVLILLVLTGVVRI